MSIKNKILTSYAIVFLTIILMILFSFDYFEKDIKAGNYFSCGTESFNEGNKEERKLFKILCASCHKLEKKLIGPALRSIEIDSISLNRYLKSEKHQPSFPQLTQKNVDEILNYIK